MLESVGPRWASQDLTLSGMMDGAHRHARRLHWLLGPSDRPSLQTARFFQLAFGLLFLSSNMLNSSGPQQQQGQ